MTATGAGTTYTYDPNGNLTQKTEGSDTWVYTWNAENQLTKVEKNAAEVARFAYDPLGRRVEKVAGGVTTSYAYGPEGILREVRGGMVLKYIHGPGFDEPLAADDGVSLSYLHADGLGSIVKTTNPAGAVTLTRRYDAWGNLELGASESGYAFTGREWDPETGLYYYRARYYGPTLGRFISEDPFGLDAGLNLYVYVDSSPTVWVDPYGLYHCVGRARCDFTPDMQRALECFDTCTHRDNCITSGRDSHRQTDPHMRGAAADMGRNNNPGLTRPVAEDCFRQCFPQGPGGSYAQEEENEGPGTHFHYQYTPGRGNATGFRRGVARNPARRR